MPLWPRRCSRLSERVRNRLLRLRAHRSRWVARRCRAARLRARAESVSLTFIQIGVAAGVFACARPANGASRADASAALQLWSVDPLVKVFRDAVPDDRAPPPAEVARGEHASLQVVIRADAPISQLRASVSAFRQASGAAELTPRAPRFVGYVPVDRPTLEPSRDQLRAPPADYPDPLLEDAAIDVPAAHAQPVWLTIPVRADAPPGDYRGTLTVSGNIAGAPVSAEQTLALRVHRAVAGPSRLFVTQWFQMHWPHMQIAPAPESDAYYTLLRRYARNMADHRQNVALISPLELADFSVGADGALAIDFARFDRWVRIFQEEGVIGRIEGSHIGVRAGGWESRFVVHTRAIVEGRVVSGTAAPDSAEAAAFYAQFFPALVAHLKARNWLGIYLQHLGDEPIPMNADTYRAMAALARKHAPELRLMDACHASDLVGAIDVWVPELTFLHRDFAHYAARQRAGEEVWFYTCVFPQGEYANRFLELPLLKTRLLHWINYRYGITGYLHWGYNWWSSETSPFTHTTLPWVSPPYLPAGDPWIVYPDADGPLDSIRYEAMRDGIADDALLHALGQHDAPAAAQLAAQLVLDFNRYNTDVAQFRAVRHELLQRLSAFE